METEHIKPTNTYSPKIVFCNSASLIFSLYYTNISLFAIKNFSKIWYLKMHILEKIEIQQYIRTHMNVVI